MIVYHTFGGRLGNQLFQAAFVATWARPGERVFFTKMDHAMVLIPDSFNGKSYLSGWWYKFFDRILVTYLIRPLVHKLRLFTMLREVPGTDQVEVRRGLVSCVRWVEGYFQGEVFFDPQKIARWKLNTKLTTLAQKLLSEIVPPGQVPVAVHWRQGDYHDYEVFGEKNPTLPKKYFKSAIQRIREIEKRPFFVIFSDEPQKVAELLNFEPSECAVSYQPPEIDVLMMSYCQHMILSNSTLAWWAGFWGQGPDKKIFAPRYWLGWKKKTVYPPGIEPSFAELLDPN